MIVLKTKLSWFPVEIAQESDENFRAELDFMILRIKKWKVLMERKQLTSNMKFEWMIFLGLVRKVEGKYPLIGF